MLKSLLAGILVTFVGLSIVNAAESEDFTQQTQSTATAERMTPIARRPSRGYLVRWRDVNTGQNISGWVRSNEPICGHAANCDCNGQYECGTYGAGETALYWDRGCYARPRVIVCDVQY